MACIICEQSAVPAGQRGGLPPTLWIGYIPLTEGQKKFLEVVSPAALVTERELGVPAAITIAQAILESDWGRSRLFVEARNPFGIKFAHLQGSQEYKAFTTEVRDGVQDRELASFARYGTLDEAFRAHALLLRRPRYFACFETDGGVHEFAWQLQQCGYATDPHYAAKLDALIDEFHLEEVKA